MSCHFLIYLCKFKFISVETTGLSLVFSNIPVFVGYHTVLYVHKSVSNNESCAFAKVLVIVTKVVRRVIR